MKTKALVFTLLLMTSTYCWAQWVGYPKAKLTAHVIDEDGKPVSGANVLFGFTQQFQGDDAYVQGLTDSNGNFTGEGYTYGMLGTKVIKEGYYFGTVSNPQFIKSIDGKWQPYDATYTTVLRKIGDPIPMYARDANLNIPAVGQPCGYDLEVGDWVGPYGKGRVADLIMTLQRQYQNVTNYDVSVDIAFSNPGDGIQETQLPKEFSNSEFIWPRLAPITGYESSLSLHVIRTPPGFSGDIGDKYQNKKYFFRVRSVEDNGNVTSALYGKISESIEISPMHAKNCYVHLYYYLNPTPNDRNMEYGSTLFKKLSEFEVPNSP
jgi:hypothetical protein